MNKPLFPSFGILVCLSIFLVSAFPSFLWGQILYSTEISGTADSSIKNLLTSVSRSFTLEDRPPLTIGLLQKRADKDVPKMLEALKSLGYYQAQISPNVQTGDPAKLTFYVQTGKQFHFDRISLRYIPGPKVQPKILLPIHSGDPALSDSVVETEKDILLQLGKQGYPFPQITDRLVTIHHDSQTMNVRYTISTGQYARFDKVKITGIKDVEEGYLHFLLPWTQGDIFNVELLNQFRKALLQTGLFSMVHCTPLPVSEKSEQVEINIDLRERKKKTVKAGIGYSKDKGMLGSLGWENRNFFGQAEKLELELEGNEKEILARGILSKPWFWQEDQTGILLGEYEKEDNDAYKSSRLQTMVGIERQLLPEITGSLGLAYRLSKIDEGNGEHTYGLFSIPLGVRWEHLDNILNPTQGFLLSLGFAPYYDTISTGTGFTKFTSALSLHLPLWQDRLIFSIRSRYAMINGASLLDIPADIRCYAGGGGSIRGYSYQKAGDLKENDKPYGGRSAFEISGEFRFRFLGNYGLSFFLDGGRAFNDQIPNLNEKFFWGTGIGLIYYTPIGPLRFDIATPLNRRKDIDSPVQVYVALGMAF